MSKFLPFSEALAVARSLSLASVTEWKVWCKEGMRPHNVPSAPDKIYKNGGWQGWVHWLGSGSIVKASKFASFGQALTFAQSLGLASQKEWEVWCKEGRRPPNVPSAPSVTYKDGGWQGWGHWLGTGNLKNGDQEFLSFSEALAVARSLNLANHFEWQQWCKNEMCPPNVPRRPDQSYKDGGCQGWVHWLGSGGIKKPSKFAPFGQALTFAQSLGLAGKAEWEVWCKEGRRPPNVPSNPNAAYKDGGWQGWGHWLGTGNTKAATGCFLPFGEALAVARSLNLANRFEWEQWCKEGMRPPNVPADPPKVYKDGGWQGWVHWLGSSGIKKPSKFAPFDQALTFAHSLGLASKKEWQAWCKEGRRPPNVPAAPNRVYKDGGWQGWGHWLGTGNQSSKAKKEQFLPFDEARRVARALRVVSQEEWYAWCRSGARPSNVPACPDVTYVHDGWIRWEHWLYHANLGAAVTAAPAAARPGTKRAAAGGAGAAAGKSSGKRRRR